MSQFIENPVIPLSPLIPEFDNYRNAVLCLAKFNECKVPENWFLYVWNIYVYSDDTVIANCNCFNPDLQRFRREVIGAVLS